MDATEIFMLRRRLVTAFWLMLLPLCVCTIFYFHFSQQAKEGLGGERSATLMLLLDALIAGGWLVFLLVYTGIRFAANRNLFLFKQRAATSMDETVSQPAVQPAGTASFSMWIPGVAATVLIVAGTMLALMLTSGTRKSPFLVVEEGSVEAFRHLIEARPEMVAERKSGETLLMAAIDADRLDMVQLLLESGAHTEWTDRQGRTALMHAVGNPRMVEALLAEGADPDASDKSGSQALHLAVACGSIECVELLVTQGARMDVADRHGRTPLALAVETMDDAVEFLLAHGADPDCRNDVGETPLHLAAKADGRTAASALLLAGADKTAVNMQGWTPLHLAALNGNAGVAKLLLNEGVDVDCCNNRGQTPLFCAVHEDKPAMVELLLLEGADPGCTDKHGNSCLHEALLMKHLDIAERLVEAGADIDAENEAGMTPRRLIRINGLENRFSSLPVMQAVAKRNML